MQPEKEEKDQNAPMTCLYNLNGDLVVYSRTWRRTVVLGLYGAVFSY